MENERNLIGQMSEQISVVRVEIEHRQTNVARVIEYDQRLDARDQHVTANVELLAVNQERIHDVSS